MPSMDRLGAFLALTMWMFVTFIVAVPVAFVGRWMGFDAFNIFLGVYGLSAAAWTVYLAFFD